MPYPLRVYLSKGGKMLIVHGACVTGSHTHFDWPKFISWGPKSDLGLSMVLINHVHEINKMGLYFKYYWLFFVFFVTDQRICDKIFSSAMDITFNITRSDLEGVTFRLFQDLYIIVYFGFRGSLWLSWLGSSLQYSPYQQKKVFINFIVNFKALMLHLLGWTH